MVNESIASASTWVCQGSDVEICQEYIPQLCYLPYSMISSEPALEDVKLPRNVYHLNYSNEYSPNAYFKRHSAQLPNSETATHSGWDTSQNMFKMHFFIKRDYLVKRHKNRQKNKGFTVKEAMDDSKDLRSIREVDETIALVSDRGTQAVPLISCSTSQTRWFRAIDMVIQTESFNLKSTASGFENLTALETQNLSEFFRRVTPRVFNTISTNSLLQLYINDFQQLPGDDFYLNNQENQILYDAGNFQHLIGKRKRIAMIDWKPGPLPIIALCYISFMSGYERALAKQTVEFSMGMVWNLSDPIHPQFLLESPAEILCIKFNPSRPSIVIGGLASGQVIMWDTSKVSPKEKSKNSKLVQDPEFIPLMQPQIPGHSWVTDGDSLVDKLSPTLLSRCDLSHRLPINDICFLPGSHQFDITNRIEQGHSDNQFMAISEDGYITIWDLRINYLQQEKLRKVKQLSKSHNKFKNGVKGYENHIWIPFLKLQLKGRDKIANIMGLRVYISPFDQDNINVCKINFVTLQGDLGAASYGPKGKEIAEEQDVLMFHEQNATNHMSYEEASNNNDYFHIHRMNKAHLGPVWSFERHPVFYEFYLTVGAWEFKIWHMGSSLPVFSSPSHEHQYLCGCWSPTRPSVVVIGTSHGFIELWDLLDRTHEPILLHRLSSDSISVLKFKPMPENRLRSKDVRQLLVVGTAVGSFHLFYLPKIFTMTSATVSARMKAFLKREMCTVQYYSWRWSVKSKEINSVSANLKKATDTELELETQNEESLFYTAASLDSAYLNSIKDININDDNSDLD